MDAKRKIDMSSEAVTSRIKQACGLGDVEMLATTMRAAVADIASEKPSTRKRSQSKKKPVN
jgi:hypothetical protein